MLLRILMGIAFAGIFVVSAYGLTQYLTDGLGWLSVVIAGPAALLGFCYGFFCAEINAFARDLFS